jgi:hypothetical protein
VCLRRAPDARSDGATSGLLAGTGLGLAGLIGMNAIVGFDATLWSMAVHGRSDPRELIVGTAFGAAGRLIDKLAGLARLPIRLPFGSAGSAGFARGIVSGSVANWGQGILSGQAGVLTAQASKSIALRDAAGSFTSGLRL